MQYMYSPFQIILLKVKSYWKKWSIFYGVKPHELVNMPLMKFFGGLFSQIILATESLPSGHTMGHFQKVNVTEG